MTIKDRYKEFVRRFELEMPMPQTELHYNTPFQLLVAVILSAQCTDKRVNLITPDLFKAFPTSEKLAEAEPYEVFEYIKSVSYPNNKAKSLVGMAKLLVEEFDNKVPDTIDNLLKLPGVGRKTANVILSVVYNKSAMAVDTHVFRVANRIGLTNNSKTPLETEHTLVRNLPDEVIPRAHHWLILHGRYVCKARKPECDKCFIADICKHNQKSGIQTKVSDKK